MQDQINNLMERVLVLELALLDRTNKKKYKSNSKEAVRERVRKHRAKKRQEAENV